LRSFAIVNLAFAAGWLNVVRGRRITSWRPADASGDADRESARQPTATARD
jgi:hypothetical protein